MQTKIPKHLHTNLVNPMTANLKAYPMEKLATIKASLKAEGKEVFDFGTGDPQMELDPGIVQRLQEAAGEKFSSYPRIQGHPELMEACWQYLQRSHQVGPENLEMAISRGSKEAIFHVALSLAGQNGKTTLIYPVPGYPVYERSAVFTQSKHAAVPLTEKNGYLLCPWDLPEGVQDDAYAIWINYPHNPTAALATREYYEKLHRWSVAKNCMVLSDECYVDLYDPEKGAKPLSYLEVASSHRIAFFSLSKRSGLTGYRSGFFVGDTEFMQKHLKARAAMGLGSPEFIQKAAAYAWQDEKHVQERKKVFFERIRFFADLLNGYPVSFTVPTATFYFWLKLEDPRISDEDLGFRFSEQGVICTPGSWFGIPGYLRFAMAESKERMEKLPPLLKKVWR